MRKRSIRYIKNPRKGVTIVELVIALSIITTVSAAALGMMISSSKSESKMMREIEVATYAENAVECFRYVIDDGNYESTADNLKNLLNKTVKNGDYVVDGNNIVLESSSYNITIKVDFGALTLEFRAVDGSDPNKEIYSLKYTYTRG